MTEHPAQQEQPPDLAAFLAAFKAAAQRAGETHQAAVAQVAEMLTRLGAAQLAQAEVVLRGIAENDVLRQPASGVRIEVRPEPMVVASRVDEAFAEGFGAGRHR